MKNFALALTALTAFAAAPAFAGGTHISFGLYSPAPVYVAPAPVYYQPAPVVYYPPRQHVYYAPPSKRYYQARNHHHFRHGYNTAWNDRYDNRGRGHGRH